MSIDSNINSSLPVQLIPSSLNPPLTTAEVEQKIKVVLEKFPEIKILNLADNKLVALGLLYNAMTDEKHPSFHSEALVWKVDEEVSTSLSHLAKVFFRDIQNNLSKIQIEMSSEEIVKVYNQYGVIQLRPIEKAETLVLGCGNCHSGVAKHQHQDIHHTSVDTLDIRMNHSPSILSFWGNPQHDQFFVDRQKKYEIIIDEGPIFSFLSSQNHLGNFFDSVRKMLKPFGYLALPAHRLSLDLNKLSPHPNLTPHLLTRGIESGLGLISLPQSILNLELGTKRGICVVDNNEAVPSDFVVATTAAVNSIVREQSRHLNLVFQYTPKRTIAPNAIEPVSPLGKRPSSLATVTSEI